MAAVEMASSVAGRRLVAAGVIRAGQQLWWRCGRCGRVYCVWGAA